VLLETTREGAFLIRYSDRGEFAGDTWTPSRELAVEVAAEEYGLAETDWIEVPPNVADPLSFGRNAAGTGVQ
jgi:hypothetical protein